MQHKFMYYILLRTSSFINNTDLISQAHAVSFIIFKLNNILISNPTQKIIQALSLIANTTSDTLQDHEPKYRH